MKKILPVILVIIVIIVLVASRNTTDSLKIGVLVPLSGNSAFLGEGARNALNMAKEDTRLDIEFIFEDTQLSPAITASAAKKLIEQDKVDVLISATAGVGNIVSPLAEQAGIVHFGIANDPTIAKGDYNFIHWTQPQSLVAQLIKELNERKFTRIGIVMMNIQGFQALAQELKKQLVEHPQIKIVDEQFFGSNMDVRDFRTGLLKSKAAQADIYLVGAFSPELEIIAKQVKELGFTAPITSLSSFENSKEPSLFEGYWYIGAASPDNSFVEKYKAEYNAEPTVGTANGYDIVLLLNEALKSGSKENLVKSLTDMKGVVGALGTLNIDSEGIVESKAITKIIKNGVAIPY